MKLKQLEFSKYREDSSLMTWGAIYQTRTVDSRRIKRKGLSFKVILSLRFVV